MGRWTGAQYRLNANRNLYVISAYRPCQSQINHLLPKSNSTFAQQYFKMRSQGVEDPNPREQFIIDFVKYMQDLNIENKDMVLLMFDANEPIEKERSGMLQLMEQTGLVDLFTLHHSTTCTIATQITGSQRIDFMLGTFNLLPYIHKCGYLPFHTNVVTDHQGMFIDLDHTLIDTTAKTQESVVREIGSASSCKQTRKYKEYIIKQFTNHIIQQRALALYQQAALPKQNRSRNFLDNLNQVDQHITEIMLKAERKFAKDPMKQWLMNEPIQQMYSVIKYWQIMISANKNNIDCSVPLDIIKKTLPAQYLRHIITYKDNPLEGLSKIKQELVLEKSSRLLELREQEAAENAMIALAENKTEDQILQRTTQAQYTKNTFASLRSRFKPPHSQGLNSVIIPNAEASARTQQTLITNPKEVETKIIQRNIIHFGQAEGTPFTQPRLTQALGYTGVTDVATRILKGHDMSVLLDSLGSGERRTLRQLNDGETSKTISINISFEEFNTGFRKWREATSTSPSGRHLGHYKALLRAEWSDAKDANSPQIITNIKNPLGNEIFLSLYHIAIATLRAGETLDRWRQVQSSMLEKDPGKPFINRLRVIHLYEADYNMLLKLLWSRKLTWRAHLDGTLHEAQAGSRPGKRAIDLVIFKEHKYLYSRLSRTPLLTMDNDAKACYDRIICNLAMMISQYFGMPAEACSMHAKTIKNMEFHLKTALGVSNEFYKHTSAIPVHGSGQGSCASPTLWLIISTILMRCLDRNTSGMAMVPIQKDGQILMSSIDGFVDDTSLFTNIPFHQTDMHEAMRHLQVATENWAELLAASGGKLELSKCFYYVLQWKFNEDGDQIPMTIHEQDLLQLQKITITDPESGEEIQINQKECTSDHKTLGVYKNILGNDTYQYTELVKKSNNLALIARSSKMSKHQARVAFQMIYLPTITYCIQACSFTLKQMETIQAKAIEYFLPAMGYRRTSARALVHGPLEMGGYNIPHLYAIQGSQKIIAIINHIRAQTELGKLLVLNLNWLQILVGRGKQLFSDNYEVCFVPDNWLFNVKRYMQECKITIISEKFWVPTLARQHDRFLMEAASDGTYTNYEMRIIHNWRLYFNATTLSDITDGLGKHISKTYWHYEYTNQWTKHRTSRLNWPKQDRPGIESFKVWNKFLTREFHLQPNGMIQQKLGKWYGSQTNSDNAWKFYYDPTMGELYEQKDFHYDVYRTNKEL